MIRQMPRADVPNDEVAEVNRRERIKDAMRFAGPRDSWPTARCRTCRRPDVVVIMNGVIEVGRLHPHTDPIDGVTCRDHGDYRDEV